MIFETRLAPQVKKIHLALEKDPLYELLQALALEWGYLLVDVPDPGTLIIANDNSATFAFQEKTILLSQSEQQGPHQPGRPLTIENLYLAIENHFFKTPRNHIRISIECPLSVQVRHLQFDSTTITLSDRGLRFVAPMELVKEEPLEMDLDFAGQKYQLTGKVVYSLMGKELGRGDRIEVGVVCHSIKREVCNSLRSQIIGSYLLRIRPHLSSNIYAEALRQLNLSRISHSLGVKTIEQGSA